MRLELRIGDACAWTYECANFRVCTMDSIQHGCLIWFYWACCYLIVGCVNTIVSSPRWILKRWTAKHVPFEWQIRVGATDCRERIRNESKSECAQCAKHIPNIFAIKFAGVFYELWIMAALKKMWKLLCLCAVLCVCYKLHIFMYKSSICNLVARIS